jgi:hypothetical protein
MSDLSLPHCPGCGKVEYDCICAESLGERFAWTDLDEEDLEDLLKDFDGDEEAMEGYLWALNKDD